MQSPVACYSDRIPGREKRAHYFRRKKGKDMEKDKSKIVRGTWAAGFTVASVWFGTHVGAGFATGNQVM